MTADRAAINTGEVRARYLSALASVVIAVSARQSLRLLESVNRAIAASVVDVPALCDALDAAEAEVDQRRRAVAARALCTTHWFGEGEGASFGVSDCRDCLAAERDEARAAARDANDRLDKVRAEVRSLTHYSATGVADVGLGSGFAWVKAAEVAALLDGAE